MADNTSIGHNIISYLKYLYASKPENKSLYSDLANKTRTMFNVQDYGADMPLDTTFNPTSMDWTGTQGLINDWLNSGNEGLISYANSLSSILGVSIQAPAPITPTEPETPPLEMNQPISEVETPVTMPGVPTVPEQEAIDYATANTNFYGNQLNAEETKARNALNAQQAQYQSLLGSNWVNGVLTQLGQLQAASIDSVNQMAELAKQSVTAQAGAQRTQVNADYIGVIDEIKQAVAEAKQMKNEDLNARGMLFSSVLTDELDKISAAGIQTIGKTEGQRVAKLAQIAANLVTATANIDIDTIKSNANITTQYGLQKLALITQDAQQKAEYTAVLAGLEVSTKGVTDYYATLKEGLPEYQKMKEYEALAPIKSAEAEAQYQQWKDEYQMKQDDINNQIKQGYLTVAEGNQQIAGLNYNLAVAKFNADQDPDSFANMLETEKLYVSQKNLNLTAKMDEAQIANINSQIKLRDIQGWRILNPVVKADESGGMTIASANALLVKKAGLIKTAAGGTDYWGNPATTESMEFAKQQLTLYGSAFLMAEVRVLAEYDPESASAVIGIQQEIYKYFNATSDNDLVATGVQKLFTTGTYEGIPIKDYLSQHGYTRAITVLETWIYGLPSPKGR